LSDVSEVLTAGMMEAVSTSETSLNFYSVIAQKTVNFILAAVRTRNFPTFFVFFLRLYR
jgi:hypothetical protein